MIKLGVNIDHIATIRQQRKGIYPDPVDAALIAENAGADFITIHLREDRRHIQDKDLYKLKSSIKSSINMECSIEPEILNIACDIKPKNVCLVPERRDELTTEGGLDIIENFDIISNVIKKLKSNKIKVSLFVDPNYEQIKAAYKSGADAVEIHTGKYSNMIDEKDIDQEIYRIEQSVIHAIKFGLQVNAGHGLDYSNVTPIAAIKGISELNIGFSIVAKSIFCGLHNAVEEMKLLIYKSYNRSTF